MNWTPSATLDIVKLRARMLAGIRAFFANRGVLEVETPNLSAAATPDPALHSLATRYTGAGTPHGQTLYLHTSPEYPMKRLLAAGSGDIYQLCKVFRDGEAGRRHNPEFTLLEWYRVGFDHHDLMAEVAELVSELWAGDRKVEKLSYQDAFEHFAGIDPHGADMSALAECARRHGIATDGLGLTDSDGWRDLLLTHVVEPNLGRGRLTFIYDYPATQAALARVRPGDPPLASRFELYVEGIELANGFHELNNATEQRRRLQENRRRRIEQGLPDVPLDEAFLNAVGNLPDCAGVALGVDRLVMLAAGAHSLQAVLAFPIDRA